MATTLNLRAIALLGMSVFASAVGLTALGEQPDKWVRYVEANGSQFVDTGIVGRWNTKAECKVEWMEFADEAFLASRSGVYPDNGRMYFCYSYSTDGEMYVAQDIGDYVSWQAGGGTWYCRFEKNRVYTYTTEFSPTNGQGKATCSVKVDGINSLFSNERAGINSGYNLYLFANNQKGKAVSPSWARCYGLKLWQGPENGGDMTLVRDFYPCMKGGKAGLYDAVSGEIFYSLNGDLICDENSEVPDEYIEYVESMGDDADYSSIDYPQYPPYLDTGIIGRSGTKISGEFAILKHEDRSILDSRKGDNRFYMVHSYNSKITCGYGGHKENSNTLTLGKKYWVETDLRAGSQTQKVAADGVTNTVHTGTTSTSIDTGYSLYLFSCNYDGKPKAGWFPKARCYGFKMWQDGVLVRDYRPCLKNGVAGLYDDVTKRIYYSSGIPFKYETRKAAKPKEIIFVDYIESDGNNTLDTFVPARSGTRAKGEMAWTQAGDIESSTGTSENMRTWNHEMYRYLEYTGSPNVFFRQQRSYLGSVTRGDTRFWMVHEYDRQLTAAHASGSQVFVYTNGVALRPTVNVKHSFDVTLNNGLQTVEWDGETVLSTNLTGNVDTGDTLHLFSTSYWRFRSAARCYGLQIWQDGTLVRDFKPCRYDNRGMLYDMVTKKLYRPSPDIPLSRTGPVVITGEEKPAQYVDYVESDGTVFVDTGVRGRSGTRADLKMQFRHSADSSFLDTRNDNLGNTVDRRFYMWHNFTSEASNNMGFGYGAWNQLRGTFAANTDYHVVSSLFAGSQSVSVNDVSYSNTSGNMSNQTVVDTGLDLYVFACNFMNTNKTTYPTYASKSRLYWLKLYQGDTDGSNLRLVRNYRPVKLTNGLVVLWDYVEGKAYLPQSMTAPYGYTTFPIVGPDGAEIVEGSVIMVR